MGTQRYISTSYWDDEWVQTLDPPEKLMYLYLMTNPLTNIAGVYKITDRRISFDTGFNGGTIKAILNKFEKAGKAHRIGEYIAIPKWPKHQNWEKAPKIKEGINSCLIKLDTETLKKLVRIGYCFELKQIFDTLSIPYDTLFSVEGDKKYPSNYSDLDLDSDSDLDIDINLEPETPPEKNRDTDTEPPDRRALSTAEAVALKNPDEKSLTPSQERPPPKKTGGTDLTPEQLALFRAVKACFETCEKTRAIMYQDKNTTAREMRHIKELVIRCTNIAPGITAGFLQNVLERFRFMCEGSHKGKTAFTPRALITPWIWELVIDSLPEPEDRELTGIIRGLYKK